MNLDEQTAKELLGIRIPRGSAVTTPDEAVSALRELGGPVVLKPLVATGGRGKAGLIRFADSADRVSAEASELLTHADRLRVEERVYVEHEHYLAITTDRRLRCPAILYSEHGGVDVESAASVIKRPVDIRKGVTAATLHSYPKQVHAILLTLYQRYRELGAELVEVNPLGETAEGELIALDAKIVDNTEPPGATDLERRAREAGLYFIELDGNVGVLANGAGLTMATLDAVRFHGGRPANFMEIGGDAYKKAKEAIAIVLANPRVKSLLVNLCGAYARTDVMIEGFLAGWQALEPNVPVVFSIHGTGEERAIQLVRETLRIEPFDEMDDAVKASIANA